MSTTSVPAPPQPAPDPGPGPAIAPAAVPRGTVALRAIVRRGLRDQRRSMLTWGLALGLLGAFMAAIYPTIEDSVSELVKSYPKGLKEAFGVESLDTVEGYVHTEMFSLLVPLAAGIFAMRSVARPLFGAEERGELDMILALPLSRRTLAAGAWLVTAVALAAVLLLMVGLTFAGGRLAGTGISAPNLLAAAAGTWAPAMFFAAVALLAGGVLRGMGPVTGVATGVLVAMYAIDLAGRLAPDLDVLRVVSVFRYGGAPLRDGLDLSAVVGLTLAGLPFAVAGVLLFERRDVQR